MVRKGRRWEGKEEVEEERKSKNKETENLADGDKDQRLESGTEGDGVRGEIRESKDGSSSNLISLMFLQRKRFPLELRKKPKRDPTF